MAKLNKVLLAGWVHSKSATIKKDTETVVNRKLVLEVMRRTYTSVIDEKTVMQGKQRIDYPEVITRNEYLMDIINTKVKKGDLVLVSGMLASRDYIYKPKCPECKTLIDRKPSVLNYIEPQMIYVIRRPDEGKEFLQPQFDVDRWRELRKMQEASNYIVVEAWLCRDAEYYDNGTSLQECNMLVAIDRPIYVREDEPEKKSDYVHVVAYGPRSKEYASALHMSSQITLIGALQTRTYKDVCHCPVCEEYKEIERTVTEVVPYNIEYRENCDKPEFNEPDFNEEELFDE